MKTQYSINNFATEYFTVGVPCGNKCIKCITYMKCTTLQLLKTSTWSNYLTLMYYTAGYLFCFGNTEYINHKNTAPLHLLFSVHSTYCATIFIMQQLFGQWWKNWDKTQTSCLISDFFL